MKKIVVIFLWVISVTAFAQTRSITGKVTDSAGEPLPAVTVAVKGTAMGTITDADGNYSIAGVSSNTVLVFSFVGMVTQEIKVGNQSAISVTMVAHAIGLDEVVAIGYGTVKKSDLTGSVATVNTKETFSAPAASLNNALQGRAAGVQVTSSSGEPGSAPVIRIRGGNSITAGNQPLYVIDGFVGVGDLSTVNPNDIESIQILRDASSTAIYGARGTNGVVLITTKKGKAGKTVVNFSAKYGMQALPKKLDVQTGSEYAAWVNSISSDPSNPPYDLNNLGEQTDWQEAIFDPAPIQDYQVSVNGGDEKTIYYVSAGYLSQQGIVNSSGFDRYSLHVNVDSKLSKVFKTGVNISLSHTIKENAKIASFSSVMMAYPLMPIYNDDGTFNGDAGDKVNAQNNLLADCVMNTNKVFNDRAFINTYLQASLFDKIIIKSTFGSDFIFGKTHQFVPSTNPNSIRNGLKGKADINRFNDFQWINENTINYNQTFGDHSLSVLGGVTAQSDYRETVIISAGDIPSDGVTVHSLELAGFNTINSDYVEDAWFSVLGRINYSYQGKYLVTASIRRDGSSRLGANNKYATFPSAAVAWNMKKESFLDNIGVIDNLKLKATYGVTGNAAIPQFSTLATFNTVAIATILDGAGVAGVQQGNLANKDLKWETTAQSDIGLEIGLFGGRLSAEIDYYYKKTTDLLLDAAVPSHTGFTSTVQNVGSLENRGVDIALNGRIISKKDFSWSASLNISTNKNKVLDLGNKSFITTEVLQGQPAGQLRVGEPVGAFYGYVVDGVDPTTGDFIYADISGPDGVKDGVVTYEDDRTVIGDATPDFYGGIHTDLKFKNFDMDAFFPFSYGNDVYNLIFIWGGEQNVNGLAEIRDNMWTAAEPDNALWPSASSTTWLSSNDKYVMDGSFLRLGTLQFGYTLPSDLFKGISNCRFYFTGTNLFLLKSKDFMGYDPDVSNFGDDTPENSVRRGFDKISYPQNRSFMIGVDITF